MRLSTIVLTIWFSVFGIAYGQVFDGVMRISFEYRQVHEQATDLHEFYSKQLEYYNWMANNSKKAGDYEGMIAFQQQAFLLGKEARETLQPLYNQMEYLRGQALTETFAMIRNGNLQQAAQTVGIFTGSKMDIQPMGKNSAGESLYRVTVAGRAILQVTIEGLTEQVYELFSGL